MRWFQNYAAGQPFDTGSISTDYSLQIAFGIQNFRAAKQPAPTVTSRATTPDDAKTIVIDGVREFVVTRGE